jgi:hypothetical protein
MGKGKARAMQASAPVTVDVENLFEALARLPPERRAQEALNASARLVEFAAYESATMVPSDWVGGLIAWAAQLDRCSHEMTNLPDTECASSTLH